MTMEMAIEAATEDASAPMDTNNEITPVVGGGSSILSDKVSRALQVRTDTPAMMTALDALANLSSLTESEHDFSNSTENRSSERDINSKEHSNHKNVAAGIDARSVRVAIEKDALQQAKRLEGELRKLVATVRGMREGIRHVSEVADEVQRSAMATVVRTAVPVGLSSNEEKVSMDMDMDTVDDTDGYYKSKRASAVVALEEEQRLAALLADAFREREEAHKRSRAIHEFMEKFDLSDADSYLLDHYNFREFSDGTQNPTPAPNPMSSLSLVQSQPDTDGFGEGMAFLDALQRVRKIRSELASTFDHQRTNTDHDLDHDTNTAPILTTTNNNKNAQRLGASSAMRMMENLATKQQRAHERLYRFLHNHLDLNGASVAHVPTSSSRDRSRLPPPDLHVREDRMDEALAHPFVRRSLTVLRAVPAYYSHTLELVAASRRSEVTRKFLLALTSGHDGMAAIEMKAHDPVDYVGDMLAFVFRSLSVECELVLGLVSDKNDDDDDNDDGKEDKDKHGESIMEDGVNDAQEDNDDLFAPMSASDVLDHAVGGVARPLKSRIAQVVTSLARRVDDDDDDAGVHTNTSAMSNPRDGSITSTNNTGGVGGGMDVLLEEEAGAARARIASLYSICGLLSFYRSAVEKAVSKLRQRTIASDQTNPGTDADEENDQPRKENPLVQCITESLDEAAHAYAASLRVYAATLETLASLSSHETSQASVANTIVVSISKVRVASPGFETNDASELNQQLQDEIDQSSSVRILSLEYLCDTIIDPSIASCTSFEDTGLVQAALTTARKSGLDSKCASKWDKIITEKERTMADELILSSTNQVLDECGLGPVANALESMKAVYVEGMAISSHPGLSQQELEAAIKLFYQSLFAPPLPSFDIMKDPVLRKYARAKTAENVATVYKQIYDAITGETGGYADLSFLGHDPAQVQNLLSM